MLFKSINAPLTMVALSLFLHNHLSAKPINKCTINGSIVYQDEPCLGSGETVQQVLKRKKEAHASAEAEKSRISAERKAMEDRSTREWQAGLDKYCDGKSFQWLKIGMTEDQMINCSSYRKPNKVNTTSTARGEFKQYVFGNYKYNNVEYVYFQNGILTAIQK